MVLQSEAVLTKWDRKELPKFITKCDRGLLQSMSDIKMSDLTEAYYKEHQILQNVKDRYYKVHQVLQSVTVITKWDVTTCTKMSSLFVIIYFGLYKEN